MGLITLEVFLNAVPKVIAPLLSLAPREHKCLTEFFVRVGVLVLFVCVVVSCLRFLVFVCLFVLFLTLF